VVARYSTNGRFRRISALRILLPRSYCKSAAHVTNMGELGAKGAVDHHLPPTNQALV
jgi:hypothetical protein